MLSDVHANLPALEAALARLEAEGVDALLCLGDVVGYGPHPEQCIAMLAEREVPCVAGNHDLMAVGRLPLSEAGELARQTIEWTKGALSADAKRWLERLPLSLAGSAGVVAAHGSLSGPSVYVRSASDAAAEIELLRERHPNARGILLGHTHHPLAFMEPNAALRPRSGTRFALPKAGRWLLNPGAVGQSRERRPVVRVLVLDGSRPEAVFLASDYDYSSCARDLRAAGLPRRTYHVPPRPARAWLAGLRSRARAAFGREG